MSSSPTHHPPAAYAVGWICCLAAAIAIGCGSAVSAPAQDAVNLALHKPASASSIENDDHNAASANDGNDQTFWCADDVPVNGPEWWQVDLEKPADLTACRITWPYNGVKYRYKVEGSADAKTWKLLSDQTASKAATRVHDLKFNDAKAVRYVKITVTGVDDGCWASISEVQLFGSFPNSGAK